MAFRMTRTDIEAVRQAKVATPATPTPRPALPQRVYCCVTDRAVELSVAWQEGKGGVKVAADLAPSAKGLERRVGEALATAGYSPPEHCDALISAHALAGALLSRAAELPIALTVAQHLGATLPRGVLAHGGLQRDGSVVPRPGGVAAALAAKSAGVAWMGHTDTAEKASVTGGDLYLADCLTTALSGGFPYYADDEATATKPVIDFAGIIGQEAAKFAVEVAAAGRHHLLFGGPPRAAKTLLAKALCGVLPPLTRAEALELAVLRERYVMPDAMGRPYEDVGRGVSLQGLTGGGSQGDVWPGSITRAHMGVLLIDEFPLLGGACIEALRVPLEDGYYELQRSGTSTRFPASFQLAATMNPCPCGPEKTGCICSTGKKRSYRGRMSHAIFERIDIRLPMEPLRTNDVASAAQGESSAEVQERVVVARDRQLARYRSESWSINSASPFDRVWEFCRCDDQATTMLSRVNPTLGRDHRDRRVAQTIADLRGHSIITGDDMRDALALTEEGGSLCATI